MKTNKILLYSENKRRVTNTINCDISKCYKLYIRSFVAASSPSDSQTKEDTTAGFSTPATSGSEDNVGR